MLINAGKQGFLCPLWQLQILLYIKQHLVELFFSASQASGNKTPVANILSFPSLFFSPVRAVF